MNDGERTGYLLAEHTPDGERGQRLEEMFRALEQATTDDDTPYSTRLMLSRVVSGYEGWIEANGRE